MSIGENLKKLRQQKGITQEQAAEAFGVSAQAVSRWENDMAYPDITLLGGIADFYDTSVDALLNVDALCREEMLRGMHAQAQALVAAGKTDAAEMTLRDGLRRFPGNAGLMLSLAETLSHKEEDAALHEAVRLCERALAERNINLKARSTAMANLLFIYLKLGQIDKAQALVPQLPHIWESREALMGEVRQGAQYESEVRALIEKMLVFLCLKIDGAKSRDVQKIPPYIQLGVDFTPRMSVDEMLKKIWAYMGE